MPDPKIKIPANLIPVVQEAADYYGIPVSTLAGVIQLGTSWSNSVDDKYVADVANAMAEKARTLTTRSEGQTTSLYGDATDPSVWLTIAAQTFGGGGASGFRTRLGALVQENVTDMTDEERWTYDKENPSPQSSYVRPKFGPVGGDKVIIGGAGASKYPNRAADIDDVGNLFQSLLGRPPKNDAEASRYVGRSIASVAGALNGTTDAAMWREHGKDIGDARRWADTISMSLTGKPLANDELLTVVQNGWTPDKLESYMRAQKYGDTDATIGAAYDLRQAITKSFAKNGLPDPTESQINFAIVNHIPAVNADAYAEQTKTKTVWASDPDKFTTARTALHQLMNQYGIVVPEKDVDTALVNQAVTGKWNADQMRQAVASGQMPGAPIGTTADHYLTTKNLADSVWKTYFPTTTMPQTFTNKFLDLTPDQITMYIRAMPSEEAKAAGVVVPVGVYTDAKNVAQQQLDKLGVVGRQPTAAEVASFASTKLDAEAIAKHYATDPGVLASNPGAQYGLSREAYFTNRRDTEKAYNARFGGVAGDQITQDTAKAANPTPGPAGAEPDWMKEVFKEGLNPQQSSSMFDTYFKNLGTPPSADDVQMFKTRSTDVYGGRVAQAATSSTGGKPTLQDLGEQSTQKRGFA